MKAGVYIHIPFCKSRCSYCDFATDVYRDSHVTERYIAALLREIEGFAYPNVEVDTVYLGGGTPSLLTPEQVGGVLNAVRASLNVSANAEITMEMNPATVSLETLRRYRALGINRASFGVQTFNDAALRMLARGHNAADARETFALLRRAGYENVSFDLIAGLPGQTIEDWRKNLDEAIALRPEHLSLYLLEIHEGTPLAEQIRSRRRPMPDEDTAAKMYEIMIERLAAAGYEQYEISNFCLPGRESRHNTKYWLLEPVFGFGVSAHSFDGGERYCNERDTARYVSMIESDNSPETMREKIDPAGESLFLGLRLNKGIDIDDYKQRFGVNLCEKYKGDFDRLFDAGLLIISNGRLMLTPKGRLFSNEVFQIFV